MRFFFTTLFKRRLRFLAAACVSAWCVGAAPFAVKGVVKSAAWLEPSIFAAARVAVLDFGDTPEGRRAADLLAASLASKAVAGAPPHGTARLSVIDRELGRAAARGAGYSGSLNLSLREARDLGGAVDCDFLVLGDAQTVRRSSSAAPVYYEAYASVFLVSARTGRLLLWDRPAAEAPAPEKASAALLEQLRERARALYAPALLAARDAEERERSAAHAAQQKAEALVDLSAEESPPGEAGGVRPPLPYRRLRPPYPDTAARAEAEATVDVLVDLSAGGEVTRVEVVRWAGFGLDESVTETVRRMHFRPTTRAGEPTASRVLLRYNFRRPPKQGQPQRAQQR